MNHPQLRYTITVLSLGMLAACSGGGGGGGGAVSGFQMVDSNIDNGAIWPINGEIKLTFNEPVDFASISSNTINIRTTTPGQLPAVGVFRMEGDSTVVFQPTCPTRSDLSDAGLLPGGVSYVMEVKGRDTASSGNSVRSAVGVPLENTQRRTFLTPSTSQSTEAFLDTRPSGPPQPVVRAKGSTDRNACYIEVGDDPDQRVYFERDGNQITLSVPDFEMPLNLYSDIETAVAIVLEFDQPVHPSDDNISDRRLALEFEDSTLTWQQLDTRVTLEVNCTQAGSRVRLDPVGVLPAGSNVRAVIRAGFQDLVGQTVPESEDDFAQAPTRTILFETLTPNDLVADAFKEDFDFGGSSPLSFEDEEALFDAPVAEWGEGELSASFSFDGTGGPNGDFDWVVHRNEIFFFDTVGTFITGGPFGIPSATLHAVNGVVDVRDLIIEEGGEVRVQGPNTMRINASGTVRIDGVLNVSGFNAKDVATLNTGNQVEIGGAGVAGGGRGGNANENTTTSTPRGGKGQGPFRQPNTGGNGGEHGYDPADGDGGKDNRRPGGGGGGRFAADVEGQTTPTAVSVVASKGTDGNPASQSAIDPSHRAFGGQPGDGPFQDAFEDNDFFGVKPVTDEFGELVRLIRGELPNIWAGYGGGGGGNAAQTNTFPTPNWNFSSDEKGGGGGGGAGGVHVKALGPIVFGPLGQVIANGGRGATGENTNFLDHIGGTGGSGSGGHIILESATLVDFSNAGENPELPTVDHVQAAGQPLRTAQNQYVDNCCRNQSNGGAGGAGVIQIHVPDPTQAPGIDPGTTDVVIPAALDALGLDDPLDRVASPSAFVMIPTFGARSKARSEWISIGGADQKPTGEGLVQFLFGGIETTDPQNLGAILVDGARVRDVTPIVAGDLEGSSTATLLPGGLSLRLSGAALDDISSGNTSGVSNDVYLRTPALLEDSVVRLGLSNNPNAALDFPIARAVFEEGTDTAGDERLTMLLRPVGPETPGDFLEANAPLGTVTYAVVPRFFEVITGGVSGDLPRSAAVRLFFQATGQTPGGLPDEDNVLVDWTANVAEFNALTPGALQYFRFEVQFDLDASGNGVTVDTEPVTLEFLRLPFLF